MPFSKGSFYSWKSAEQRMYLIALEPVVWGIA